MEFNERANLPNAELFEITKSKFRIKQNSSMTLEHLCMKAVINHIGILSPALANLAPLVKSAFLEYLLQLTKQKTAVPLSLQDRWEVVKLLLNERMKKFDFLVLHHTERVTAAELADNLYRTMWTNIYDNLWTELTARCPNLEYVRDVRPGGVHEKRAVQLHPEVLKLDKLTCLETNCYITSDSLKELCERLKMLRRLDIYYEVERSADVSSLSQLEHLEELHLRKMYTNNWYEKGRDIAVIKFKKNFTNHLPNLKIFNSVNFDTVTVDVRKLVNKLCSLEECRAIFDDESEISRLAACMPNLRRLAIGKFSKDWNPQLMRQFRNLNSLKIVLDKQSIAVLTLVGPQLRELCIKCPKRRLRDACLKVLKVFQLCPFLQVFELHSFKGSVDLAVPVLAEQLKLKKLVLTGDFRQAEGLLPLIVSAPRLEQVKLDYISFSRDDTVQLVNLVSEQSILQNLTSFELVAISFVDMGHSLTDQLLAMESVAKNIITFCPKLQTAQFDFDSLNEGNRNRSVLAPYLELMTMSF